MSEYPRSEPLSSPTRPFFFDRFFAIVRVATLLYSSFLYFEAFRRRWEWVAPPGLSIFAWAPPLGSHLTSQIVGAIHGIYLGFGLWHGRGWALAYSSLTCFGACVSYLIVRPSTLTGMFFFLGIYVPSFLYCGLRLIGVFGPPSGSLELRRMTADPKLSDS